MMIDKNKLITYLDKRKKYIEFKKFSGISEIISGLSMLVTLVCSSSYFTSSTGKFFLVVGYCISAIILLWGGYQFILSLNNYFTTDLCFKEIVGLDDEKKNIQYVLIIKDNESGRYLLVYNATWKCFLFPSYSSDIILNSAKTEKDALLQKYQETFQDYNQKVNIENIGKLDSYKLNVGEKIFTNYEFRFFLVCGSNIPRGKPNLKINGLKFKWMTTEQMYSKPTMKKKNKDVIDFVNNHTNVAKI